MKSLCLLLNAHTCGYGTAAAVIQSIGNLAQKNILDKDDMTLALVSVKVALRNLDSNHTSEVIVVDHEVSHLSQIFAKFRDRGNDFLRTVPSLDTIRFDFENFSHYFMNYQPPDSNELFDFHFDISQKLREIFTRNTSSSIIDRSPTLDYTCSSFIGIASTRNCGFWKCIREIGLRNVFSTNPYQSVGIQQISEVANSITGISDTLELFRRNITDSNPHFPSTPPCLVHIPSIDSSEDERNLFWNRSKKISRPTIESYAFTLLQDFWNGYFTMNILSFDNHQKLIQSLHICSDMLQSVLVVEYEGALKGHDGGGWTNTLESSLEAANKNLLLAMQRLGLPSANVYDTDLPLMRSGSISDPSFTDLEYAHGTSVSTLVVKSSILLLNHGLRCLSEALFLPLEGVEPTERSKWLTKLHDSLLGILTYLSVVMFEYLTFLYSCSLRAFLKQVPLMTQELTRSLDFRSFVSITSATISSVLRLPRPWGGSGRYDILTEIWGAWNRIQDKDFFPSSANVMLPHNVSRWIWSESYRRFPALIINLDSRSDRSRTLTLLMI